MPSLAFEFGVAVDPLARLPGMANSAEQARHGRLTIGEFPAGAIAGLCRLDRGKQEVR